MTRHLSAFFLLTFVVLAACGVKEDADRRRGGSPAISGTKPDTTTASLVAASATAVAGGLYHTCALTKTKEVRCWGGNENGELGNGTQVESAVPVTVSSLSDVKQIEAGGSHTCALTTAGGVKCWGKNTWGQLGNSTYANSSVPVDVTELASGVKEIAIGANFSCALKASDGSVVCWGLNNYGQIGNNTFDPSSGPSAPNAVKNTDQSNLSGAISITAGGGSACAIKNGGLTCWGLNQLGQLGLGQNTGPETCPDATNTYPCAKTAYATTITQVASVTAGQYSFCARLTDGTVKCWGDNRSQELANGATLDVCREPGASIDSSCGITVRYAQLTAGYKLTGVTSLMSGMANGFYCATVNSKTLCWGGINPVNLGGMAPPMAYPTEMTLATAGITKLDGGWYHVCGITPGDDVECWGRNVEGQLGAGDKVSHIIPKNVFGF